MDKIDAHQHFWRFDPARDGWISAEMAAIRGDFLPPAAQPLLAAHGLVGAVAVQAHPSETETDFLLGLAAAHGFIRGVVGWVDLQAANVAERLAHYQQFDKLKGFRAMLQGEADRALLLQPAFRRGLAALGQHGFTCDLLILPDQLAPAATLAGALPNQLFVVDHLAKPPIKSGRLANWARDLRAVAAHENVYCKVSGLVTEADWHHWQPPDIYPYLDVAVAAFGPRRLLYGSDWPVCEVAGGYARAAGLLADYLRPFSASEQAQVWGGTATHFYNLSS